MYYRVLVLNKLGNILHTMYEGKDYQHALEEYGSAESTFDIAMCVYESATAPQWLARYWKKGGSSQLVS